MSPVNEKKTFAWISLVLSVFFFVMGLSHPLMQTGYGFGPIRLKQEMIYLGNSFQYFFQNGEFFVGLLLLFTTLAFPILKYFFLLSILLNGRLNRSTKLYHWLELLNKWAMLDVFVVALIILNMKFDSEIILSDLESGTTYFAISIVLLITTSFLIRRMSIKSD